MKVICKNCGKRFDYDIYGGLCPKCSTYYREWNDNSAYKEQSSHMEKTLAGRNISLKQKQNDRKPKHSVLYYTVTVMLLIVFFLTAAIPFGLCALKNQKGYEAMKQEQAVKPQKIKMGTPFFYQTAEDGEYKITITGVTTDTDSALEVPEGYDMVTVRYHITRPEDAASEDKIEEEELARQNPVCIGIHMRPYLMSKKGVYLEPVSVYDIRERKGWDLDDEDAVGLSERFQYRDGVIYFLVKKEDVKGIWISSFDYEEEEYSETTLRGSFQITGVEVEG